MTAFTEVHITSRPIENLYRHALIDAGYTFGQRSFVMNRYPIRVYVDRNLLEDTEERRFAVGRTAEPPIFVADADEAVSMSIALAVMDSEVQAVCKGLTY